MSGVAVMLLMAVSSSGRGYMCTVYQYIWLAVVVTMP
jgi:hypothetical protein